MQQSKVVKHLLISFLVSVGLFLALFLFSNFVFSINDDRTIESLLSGAISGKESSGIFLSSYLSFFLCKLYSICPNFPFYGVTYLIFLFSFVFFLVFFILQKSKTISQKIILFAISAISFILFIANTQFTLITGMLCVPLIIIALNYNSFTKKEKIAYLIVFTLFSLMAISIREKVFLMSLPFVGLGLLLVFLKSRKAVIPLLVVILLIVSSNYGVNSIMNNNEQYKTFQEYNIVRSDLYDYYGFPKYEDNTELYDSLGIDREAYDLFTHYTFDIPEANLENMTAIRDYQKNNKQINIIKNICSVSVSYYKILFYLIVFMIVFVIEFVYFFKKSKMFVFILSCSFLGGIIISLTISILMKFPARLANCIMFFNTAVILTGLFKMEIKKLDKLFYNIVICLLLLITFIHPTSQLFKNNNETISYINYYKEVNEYISSDLEHIYYVDHSLTIPLCKKLLDTSEYYSNIYYKDWFTFSEAYNDMMKNLGYLSFYDMLKYSDNFRVISINFKSIKRYNDYALSRFSKEFVFVEYIGDNMVFELKQN